MIDVDPEIACARIASTRSESTRVTSEIDPRGTAFMRLEITTCLTRAAHLFPKIWKILFHNLVYLTDFYVHVLKTKMGWLLVQTEHSIPLGKLRSSETTIPFINLGQRLLSPAAVFSPALFEELGKWQHDEQYVRWARLLINFQEIGATFQVLVKDRRFKLISGIEFVYKAHRGWKRTHFFNLDRLPRECRIEVAEIQGYQGKFSIWIKRERLLLFNEQFGNTRVFKIKK